jgi:uncharacterized phiE125 gp8 family phage protein
MPTLPILLPALIVAAREYCEGYLHRKLITQAWDWTMGAFPHCFQLPFLPVSAVTSVKYYDSDGVQRTVSSANYRLDISVAPPVLEFDDDYSFPTVDDRADAVEIVYAAGYTSATCPALIKQYVLLRIGTMYEHRTADDAKPPLPAPWVARLLDRWRVIGA